MKEQAQFLFGIFGNTTYSQNPTNRDLDMVVELAEYISHGRIFGNASRMITLLAIFIISISTSSFCLTYFPIKSHTLDATSTGEIIQAFSYGDPSPVVTRTYNVDSLKLSIQRKKSPFNDYIAVMIFNQNDSHLTAGA